MKNCLKIWGTSPQKSAQCQFLALKVHRNWWNFCWWWVLPKSRLLAKKINKKVKYKGPTQSFQKRCTIWADFLNQTFFTTIIHFFMLYMPVKSDGQKDNLRPRYEAAKWGQVRFCHAKCDSFHLMVRKCMLFFPLERFCNNATSFQKRCKKVPSVNGNEAVTLKPSVQLEK